MLLLPSTLTVREARDTVRMLAQALEREKAGPVAVDASQLAQFDSVALAVLLECRRLAEAFGRGFEVRGAPPKLAALARLYGIESVLMPA